MKLLVDMNRSPRWVAYLGEAQFHSEHLLQLETELRAGALLIVEEASTRVRLLPLNRE
jgi:predicted nuclease of predicted toxin-antitoxin system